MTSQGRSNRGGMDKQRDREGGTREEQGGTQRGGSQEREGGSKDEGRVKRGREGLVTEGGTGEGAGRE